MKDLFAVLLEVLRAPATAWRCLLALILGGHIAWACGLLPGIQGFALAQDVEARTKTIETRLGAIEQKQDIGLRLALAAEICRLYTLRESATDPLLRLQLAATLEQQQQQHAAVTSGTRYPLAECATRQ